jgi:SAM-dependent methyltransferase
MTSVSDTNVSAGEYGDRFSEIYDDIFPRETITTEVLEWIMSTTKSPASSLIELGAGTGRVTIPLVDALTVANSAPPRAVAVDISAPMLDILREHDPLERIETRVADVSTYDDPQKYDLVLCVCATLSMIVDPAKQQATLDRCSELLAPGGTLIIETHNPDWVRRFIGPANYGSYFVPYPGKHRGLASFATIDDDLWLVEHVWIDGPNVTQEKEVSRLTSVSEIDGYADKAGFSLVSRHGSLSGSAFDESSSLSVSVYNHAGATP